MLQFLKLARNAENVSLNPYLNKDGRILKLSRFTLASQLLIAMKKLLIISILASILVIAFNKCYCNEGNLKEENTMLKVDTSTETLAGVAVRLRKRT